MSKLEFIMATIIVSILDKLTSGLQIKSNKITYISYRSNYITNEIKKISKEVKIINENIEEVYLMLKYKNTLLDKLKYIIEIIKQVYNIKTSKIVVIDGNNFVVSKIDKRNTRVIQIWHACGAIKKFGQDYERKYNIKNYDYIITCSSSSKYIMASAFGVNEEQVLTLGYSKTDDLFDAKKMNKYKNRMYEKYPFLQDKKIVLYAPTFRGDGIYDKEILYTDLDRVADSIGDKYIILYKLHPIIDKTLKYKSKNIYDVSNENLYKLFSVTDILVSDFSAIIYDFTILEKPIVLYAPDLEEYRQKRGLYVDYEQFAPGKIAYNEEALAKVIIDENYEIDKVIKLKNKFFDFLDGKSSKRIAKFINTLINEY